MLLLSGRLGGVLDAATVRGERDVHVAARRVRVRAHLVRSPHQLDGLVGVVDRGQGDRECDGEVERAVLRGHQHDLGIDRDVSHLLPAAPGHGSQRALEAGGVADREQLLGVGAPTAAAHLLRQAEIHLQGAVRGAAVAFGPPSRDVGLRGVDGGSALTHARSSGWRGRWRRPTRWSGAPRISAAALAGSGR